MSEKYSVENEYLDDNVAERYLKRKSFTGLYGAYKSSREINAVRQALSLCSPSSIILDAPCGFGRWFDELSKNKRKIIGIDVSDAMIRAAQSNIKDNHKVITNVGNIRNLDMKNKQVDYVFSFALFKHLPDEIKADALAEFKRVARSRIIISIPVYGIISQIFWFIRGRKGFPVSQKKLCQMCAELDLQIVHNQKIGIPFLGLESLYVIETIS
jgi:ubiquinone/menaquinone biosynthesis C-methylase UbiE